MGIFITIVARIFSLIMPSYVSKSIDTIEKHLDGQLGVHFDYYWRCFAFWIVYLFNAADHYQRIQIY